MASNSISIDIKTNSAELDKLIQKFNDLNQPVKTASNSIAGMVDDMKRSGQSMTTANKELVNLATALGQLDTKSKQPRQALGELTTVLNESTDAYKKLTQEEKNSDFGKALKQSINQLTERAKGMKGTLTEVQTSINGTATESKGLSSILDDVAGKFGMNVSQLTKFGTVAGAAAAATKVMKDTFFASEANIDAWGEAMREGTDVYEGFLASINNGDISGFLSNIDDIIKAAKDAYDALDTLGTMQILNSPAKSANEAEITRIRTMLRSGKYIAPANGTPAAKEGSALTKAQTDYFTNKLAELLKSNRGYTKQEINQNSVATAALEREVAQRYGMSVGNVRKYTQDYSAFNHGRELYQKYVDWQTSHRTSTFNNSYGIGGYQASSSGKNPYEQYKGLAGLMSMKTDEEGIVQDLFNQRKKGSEMMKQMYAEEGAAYRSMGTAASRFNTHHTQTSRGGKTTTTKTEAVFDASADSIKEMQDNISLLKKQLDDTTVGSEKWLETLRQLADWQSKLNSAQQQEKDLLAWNTNGGGAKGVGIGKLSQGMSDSELDKYLSDGIKRFAKSKVVTGNGKKDDKKGTVVDGMQNLVGGIDSIGNNLQTLGIDLGTGFSDVLGKFSAALSILQTIAVICEAIQSISTAGAFLGIFKNGGVAHAANGIVAGRNYVDRVPATLSSGEMVMNEADQSRLWSAIKGGNFGGGGGRSTISGEQIVTVVNAYGRRTGRGEILR